MNPWTLYDELIDLIPSEVCATDALLGNVAYVRNDAGGAGIASHDRGGITTPEAGQCTTLSQAGRHGGEHSAHDLWAAHEVAGRHLRDVAALSKSWDFSQASLGVAALNSWLNSAERVAASGLRIDTSDTDVFAARAPEISGMKVAMIGHFSNGIAALSGTDVRVLERHPCPGDLPDSACEYVLPASDVVFITGMTVANKTLPRLLELAAGARMILVGASVPFAPEVFAGRGAPELATAYVADPDGAAALVSSGANMPKMRPVTHRFTAITPP